MTLRLLLLSGTLLKLAILMIISGTLVAYVNYNTKTASNLEIINLKQVDHDQIEFLGFTSLYKKDYKESSEFNLRKGLYLENKRFVELFNREKEGMMRVALNEFSDWHEAEINQMLGLKVDKRERLHFFKRKNKTDGKGMKVTQTN